jgi:cation transport ATPase
MRLSRAVSWVVVQSLILAVVIKLGVVMLVYTGWGRLWLAVASDGASLVAVMLNGSRPLFFAQRVYT